MYYLNAWNEEENEISIDLHDQPLSKKQKTVLLLGKLQLLLKKQSIYMTDQHFLDMTIRIALQIRNPN